MKNVSKIADNILNASSIKVKVKNSINVRDIANELARLIMHEGHYWEDALIALEDANPKVDGEKIKEEFENHQGVSPDSFQIP